MHVLGIDTSTAHAAIALVDDGRVLAEMTAFVRAGHGETLLGHIEHLLRLARLSVRDIELVAVGTGPGSFTGVRIGVATAKGLAIARRIPVLGVSSLTALAQIGAARGRVVACFVDAHKDEVYAAAYRVEEPYRLTEVAKPFHAPLSHAIESIRSAVGDAPVTVCGDGVRVYGQGSSVPDTWMVLDPRFDVPRGSAVAFEASRAFASGRVSDARRLEPLYVRHSDAQLPGARRLPAVDET